MDDKTKFRLIEAIKAFKGATTILNDAWTLYQSETDETVGTSEYPFPNSFEDVECAVGDWADRFVGDLDGTNRFWIDLRDDGELFWIYKEVGGLIMNVAGVDIIDSSEGLTEINEDQYEAIDAIWDKIKEQEYPSRWIDDQSDTWSDQILDIVNIPNYRKTPT